MTPLFAAGRPALNLDLYDDSVLRDSREAFARIREAGPVVWLPRHRMYAMGRFDDVLAALRNDTVFLSGQGVAANALTNRVGRDTTLFSDGDTHDARRKVLMRLLAAKMLTSIQSQVDEHAEKLVEGLVRIGSFEAAADFASYLPLTVVADLVGVRGDSRQMLRWAAATFEALGPLNRRGLAAAPVSLSLLLYTLRLRRGRVVAGSWAASVFAARDRGEISTREAKALVVDLVAPSLDTTILASTHLLWVLARNAEAWAELLEDESLIPSAVVENVRLASPIRGFTRRLASDHEVDGVTIPRGARVALLFGAANSMRLTFRTPSASTSIATTPSTSDGATARTPVLAYTSPSSRCRRSCARCGRALGRSASASRGGCATTLYRASAGSRRASLEA